MIKYQRYTDDFYEYIYNFLLANDVEPPAERTELDGNGVIAFTEERIVGFIWALVGSTSKAYVDFFAVDKEYRGKTVAFRLIETIEELLKEKKVKKYNFYVEKWNTAMVSKLIKYNKKYNIRPLADLHYFQRELS